MQSAKDSFYIALRDRLAALNPARTVVVDGVMRPAVLVAENEPATAAAWGPQHARSLRTAVLAPLPNAFYLQWGAAEVVKGAESARRPLLKIECAITYRVSGVQAGGVDRGRALAALDCELLSLCNPPRTPKCDHAQAAVVALGSTVFWGGPEFGAAEALYDELRRTARLLIFFFPEVDQA